MLPAVGRALTLDVQMQQRTAGARAVEASPVAPGASAAAERPRLPLHHQRGSGNASVPHSLGSSASVPPLIGFVIDAL